MLSLLMRDKNRGGGGLWEYAKGERLDPEFLTNYLDPAAAPLPYLKAIADGTTLPACKF
jgi:hypothetical protein